MNLRTVEREARLVVIGASLLLVLDLFLDWQRVAVQIAGAVDVEAGSAGWEGWGLIAGALAIALVVTRLVEVPAADVTGALLALGLLLATALAVFTGDASVAAPPVAVEVDSTTWAAWVGFGLAIVIAIAAFAPLVAGAERRVGGIARHGAA